MKRQQTSWINIRNFIGTESRRTSRPLSVIAMLPRAGAGGLQASTVTYFVPSASCAIRDHSHSEVSDAPRLPLAERVFDCRPRCSPLPTRGLDDDAVLLQCIRSLLALSGHTARCSEC